MNVCFRIVFPGCFYELVDEIVVFFATDTLPLQTKIQLIFQKFFILTFPLELEPWKVFS